MPSDDEKVADLDRATATILEHKMGTPVVATLRRIGAAILSIAAAGALMWDGIKSIHTMWRHWRPDRAPTPPATPVTGWDLAGSKRASASQPADKQ